jgi:hypothetical protein
VAHRPESEWGTETELKAAVQEFCQGNGYDFLPLEQDHPAGFNLLAAQALYKKHTADGGKCGGYSINILARAPGSMTSPAVLHGSAKMRYKGKLKALLEALSAAKTTIGSDDLSSNSI